MGQTGGQGFFETMIQIIDNQASACVGDIAGVSVFQSTSAGLPCRKMREMA